jgi:hypothetical protein
MLNCRKQMMKANVFSRYTHFFQVFGYAQRPLPKLGVHPFNILRGYEARGRYNAFRVDHYRRCYQ